MFVPSALMLALSLVMLFWGLLGVLHAIVLTKDRKNLVRSMERRTGRTMGTVIGGSALSYGERLACPLVRFEVGDQECLATGPAIASINKASAKGIHGDVLCLGEVEFGYVQFHTREFVGAVRSIRESERGGDGMRELWDLAYEDSVISELYPVGKEVAVAYDETYPKSNCMVLLPDGSDGTLITSKALRQAWSRPIAELVSGIALCGVALGFLTNHLAIML